MGSIELSLEVTMAALLIFSLIPLSIASPFGYGISGISYEARSPQGLHGYGGYGYTGIGFGKREAEPSIGLGALSFHPDGGVHSEYRSPQGLNYGIRGYGKREAEPFYGRSTLGVHPTGVSYSNRS